MRKIFYGILLAIFLYLIISTVFLSKNKLDTQNLESTESTTEDITATKNYPTIVLDAGHGGFDPGKVGINGALEKDINLAIVKKLQTLLEGEGFTVFLTRESDKILGPANSKSPKKDDMIERISFIKDINPFFTISIHQNSFTNPSVTGPQVFYYKDSEPSATMAYVLQDVLNAKLNPEKKRAPQANQNYYLLTRTPTPTVIVECGFLSNSAEADLLTQDSYQDELAHAIFLGILSYYESVTSTQTPSE